MPFRPDPNVPDIKKSAPDTYLYFVLIDPNAPDHGGHFPRTALTQIKEIVVSKSAAQVESFASFAHEFYHRFSQGHTVNYPEQNTDCNAHGSPQKSADWPYAGDIKLIQTIDPNESTKFGELYANQEDANRAWATLTNILHSEDRRYAMAYYSGAPNQRAQFDIMTYCEGMAVWRSPRRYWIMSNNQSSK